MAGFFSKIFGGVKTEEPQMQENPAFGFGGKSSDFDGLQVKDVKKFADSLQFDYSDLNKDQKAILNGMEHRLQKYSKELSKDVSAERMGDIAREVFIISCASNKPMQECLQFHKKCGFGVEELNDFSKDDPSLNPLAASLTGGRDQKETKQLIKVGAEVNFKSATGNNLAHFAAAIGVNDKMMKFLIDEGVEINAENKHGMTVRDIASLGGHQKLSSCVEENGGKMGSLLKGVVRAMRGDSPANRTKEEELSEAVVQGNVAGASAMIAAGANVNTIAKDGRSILQQAVDSGNVTMASTVSYHANVDTKSRVRGESAAMENIVDHVGSAQTQVGQGGDGSGNFSWVEYILEKMAKEAREQGDSRSQ